MPLSDRSQSVKLHCQTCADAAFEHDPDNLDAPITCVGCGRIYAREELLALNGEIIEANLDEVKAELVEDARKHLKDAFRNSRYFKIR